MSGGESNKKNAGKGRKIGAPYLLMIEEKILCFRGKRISWTSVRSDLSDAGASVSSKTFRSRLADVRLKETKLLPSIKDLFPNNASFIFQQDSAPGHKLNDNKIKSLPSDLSDALPKLDSLYVENNLMVSFAEAPFGKFPVITYIHIGGNPVKCDCASKWVVGRKRPYIEGICTDRKDKKRIRDLEAKDFSYCPKI
ncbi:UNVERIFIED_CONTAM: hypothetical protein NCL1_17946 [Trichonephila clavipes]